MAGTGASSAAGTCLGVWKVVPSHSPVVVPAVRAYASAPTASPHGVVAAYRRAAQGTVRPSSVDGTQIGSAPAPALRTTSSGTAIVGRTVVRNWGVQPASEPICWLLAALY